MYLFVSAVVLNICTDYFCCNENIWVCWFFSIRCHVWHLFCVKRKIHDCMSAFVLFGFQFGLSLLLCCLMLSANLRAHCTKRCAEGWAHFSLVTIWGCFWSSLLFITFYNYEICSPVRWSLIVWFFADWKFALACYTSYCSASFVHIDSDFKRNKSPWIFVIKHCQFTRLVDNGLLLKSIADSNSDTVVYIQGGQESDATKLMAIILWDLDRFSKKNLLDSLVNLQ